MRVLVAVVLTDPAERAALQRMALTYREMPSVDVDLFVLAARPTDLGPLVHVRTDRAVDETDDHARLVGELFTAYSDDYDVFVHGVADTLVDEAGLTAFAQVSEVLPDDMAASFVSAVQTRSGELLVDVRAVQQWDLSSVMSRQGMLFAQPRRDFPGVLALSADQIRRREHRDRVGSRDAMSKSRAPHRGGPTVHALFGVSRTICLTALDEFTLVRTPATDCPEDGITLRSLQLQVEALRGVEQGHVDRRCLLNTDTGLSNRIWDRKNSVDGVSPAIRSVASSCDGAILSVGCTTGEYELSLFPHASEIVGIPVDDVVGSVARDRGIATVAPDFASALADLEGRRFDVILLQDLLHRTANPPALLAQLAKLMKPAGLMVLTTPNMQPGMWQRRQSQVPPAGGFAATGVHRATRSSLGSWLATADMDASWIDPDADRGRASSWLSPVRRLRRSHGSTLEVVARRRQPVSEVDLAPLPPDMTHAPERYEPVPQIPVRSGA